MKMIILRSKSAGPSESVPVGALRYDPVEFSIELADLSSRELADSRRDPTIFGAAPPMPIGLVRPFAQSASAIADGTQSSWGVEAVGATRSDFTGEGVSVAVLDTGLDRKHAAFESGLEVVTANFTTEPDGDSDGHGTHCAGTIFGRNVGDRRIGVAPGVSKALIAKVLGAGGSSTEAILNGVLWAYQNKAHIISMSVGMDFTGYQEQLELSYPKRLATSMALAGYLANVRLFDRLSQTVSGRSSLVQGAILVAAAGNESRRDEDAKYRITVAPPAAGEAIVSVAALDRTAHNGEGKYIVAPFSNSGARLSAPGVAILSARTGGGLATLSGTSMAAPHVAGVAALWAESLIRQGRPFRAGDLIDSLIRSTTPLRNLDPDDVGLGLVQAP